MKTQHMNSNRTSAKKRTEKEKEKHNKIKNDKNSKKM